MGASSHSCTVQVNEQSKMQGPGIQQQKNRQHFLPDTSGSCHYDCPHTKGGHLGHPPWGPKGFSWDQSPSVMGTVQPHVHITYIKAAHVPSNLQCLRCYD